MSRLNLTLDRATADAIRRIASREHVRRAAAARKLLGEALARRAAVDRARRLARDYAAGARDTRRLLDEMEIGQLDLLGDENG